MSAQKGKDLLLKVEPAPQSGFTTVAGMRSRKIAFNAETIDITDFESNGRWRHLLAGAGVQRASVSGSGIFKDQASDEIIRALFFGSQIADWQLVIPDFGEVRGPFQITSLEYSGEHNGEVGFEMALESAGQITFTGAA